MASVSTDLTLVVACAKYLDPGCSFFNSGLISLNNIPVIL